MSSAGRPKRWSSLSVAMMEVIFLNCPRFTDEKVDEMVSSQLGRVEDRRRVAE
jgi:hypothetical protein